MNTEQNDILTMYNLVVNQYLPSEPAKELLAVPLVATRREELLATLGLLKTAAEAQDSTTTGLTGTRDEVKKQAAVKGDIIRQMVLEFPPSATAAVELKDSPLKTLHGDETVFLAYLQRILNYLPSIGAADRKLVAYDDAAVGAVLATILLALTSTKGEIRLAINTSSGATVTIEDLLTQATAQAKSMDRAVKMQVQRLPVAVADYFKARRIIHTAAHKVSRPLQGPAVFGVPTLVLDRTLVPLLSLTLGNRSAKGYTLGYYLADTPTALPQPGQVVRRVVRNKPYHLGSFAELGPDTARYLLVVLEQVGPAGKYYVVG